MDSRLEWRTGDSGFQLIEVENELILREVTGEQSREVARMRRGRVHTAMEIHSDRQCEVHITTDTGRLTIFCPHDVCSVLRVKLKKFQGGTLDVSTR